MKLGGIILAGTLGLSSLAVTGDSINKENIQEAGQKPSYMCLMMEVESMEEMRNMMDSDVRMPMMKMVGNMDEEMKEMRDKYMQHHEKYMNREETDNHRHQKYGCCM